MASWVAFKYQGQIKSSLLPETSICYKGSETNAILKSIDIGAKS